MPGHRPPDMVDVALDEEDLPDGREPAAPPADEVAHRPTARRAVAALVAHPRAVLAATLVIAVAVAGSVVATQLRARERAERYADVAGVARPWDGSLTALWTQPSDTFEGLAAIQEGRMVFLSEDRTSARALDTDTGEELWDRKVEVDGAPAGVSGCTAYTQDVATIPVVCVVRASESAGDPPRLARLDLGTGTWTVLDEYRGWTTATVVGSADDDVLVLLQRDDGHLEVRRQPATGGPARWVHEDVWEPGVVTGDPVTSRTAAGALEVTGAVDLALDVATGAALRWWPDAPQGTVMAIGLPGGARAVWADGPDGSEGAVHEADGTVRFPLKTRPLYVFPDDLSAPSVLLLQDDRLRAVDAGTGEQLWERSLCMTGPSMRLDGSLLCTDATGSTTTLTRLDVTTGETLWATEVDGESGPTVTDGYTLLLTPYPTMDGGEARASVALRWSDGAVLVAPVDDLPSDAFPVTLDRRLYLATRDGLTRLG